MSASLSPVVHNFAELENTTAYVSTSLTYVATGDNITITPITASNIKIAGVIDISNNTAADGVGAEITYASGSVAIASGTAVSGTVVASSVVTHTQNVASNPNYVSISAIVKNLTVGVPYTFSLNVTAITAGSASFAIQHLMIEDF